MKPEIKKKYQRIIVQRSVYTVKKVNDIPAGDGKITSLFLQCKSFHLQGTPKMGRTNPLPLCSTADTYLFDLNLMDPWPSNSNLRRWKLLTFCNILCWYQICLSKNIWKCLSQLIDNDQNSKIFFTFLQIPTKFLHLYSKQLTSCNVKNVSLFCHKKIYKKSFLQIPPSKTCGCVRGSSEWCRSIIS